MMHIDYPLRIPPHKLTGENLHVAGKHNKVDALKQFQLFLFGGSLVVGPYEVEWDTMKLCQPLRILVVADDHRYFARQLSALVPVKQIGEAVSVLRNHNCH